MTNCKTMTLKAGKDRGMTDFSKGAAHVNGQAIGAGAPGPVTLRLQKRYWEVHEDPRFTLKIDYS
jgi:hypothetical protein